MPGENFQLAVSALLMAMGVYMIVVVRALPLRPVRLIRGLRNAFRAEATPGITPIEAFSAALGGCVGTGNIAGVAGAIAIGGPGAVFWMWISGIVGMATKYAEAMLAIRFRPNSGKEPAGGAMYCIVQGMGRRAWPLAAAFSVFALAASLACGDIVQSNTMALAVSGAVEALAPGTPLVPVRAAAGVVCGGFLYFVMRGGAKGVCRTASFLVPVMSLLYIGAALGVILLRREALPGAVKSIFEGAFGLRPVLGGVGGFTLAAAARVGIMRGTFSNEAGIGSATMAYSTPGTGERAERAMPAALDVFVDTLLICTLTALAVLTGAAIPYGEAGVDGMAVCLSAFSVLMPKGAAGIFLAVSVALFAFSSMLAWSMYGERALRFLTKGRGTGIYRACFALIAALGAVTGTQTVWSLGEGLNALMALPNLVMLLALAPLAAREIRDYSAWRRWGRCGKISPY